MKFIPHDFSQKIVIDEIQRVPELLNDVYRLIEQKNNQLILINSSARKLRAKGVKLLAGRTLTQLPALLSLK
jgi:predicted AAA+ superfamily ATPase